MQQHPAARHWIRPGVCAFAIPQYLHAQDAQQLFDRLRETCDWQQGSIRMFGKTIAEPRLTDWCGDRAYHYSGRALPPKAWSADLQQLRDQLTRELDALGIAPLSGLNHALLNYYPDGDASMGWHRDNERELGERPVICSISLGTARRFVMRPRARDRRAEQLEWSLGQGDLLVMYGDSQLDWEHALVKTKTSVGPRLNITFRSVVGA